MKKIAAWACLIIYLNAAAQSLLPWVSDTLAHIFFWQDHLEHVHHGHVHSHHVGIEMAAQEEDAHSHLPTGHSTLFDKDVLSAHFVPVLVMPLLLTADDQVSLNTWWVFHYQGVLSDIFLPPPDRAV